MLRLVPCCCPICSRGAGQLDQAIFSLTTKVLHHESLAAAATERSLAAAQVEHEVQLMEMQMQLQQQAEQVEELQEELEQVSNCHVV
jgi:TolA-binding protein